MSKKDLWRIDNFLKDQYLINKNKYFWPKQVSRVLKIDIGDIFVAIKEMEEKFKFKYIIIKDEKQLGEYSTPCEAYDKAKEYSDNPLEIIFVFIELTDQYKKFLDEGSI